MIDTLRLAARNLMRYRRRTWLTAALITIGMAAMLLFVALSGSFKQLMVGQITDSMLGHIQVHRKGYVASIDSLPLQLNLQPRQMNKLTSVMETIPGIEAWSPRVKLGAMFSNYNESTTIRLNGVDPARETATVPLLAGRLIDGGIKDGLVARGHVLIPELIAKGMKVKPGDAMVLVATNRDGSVNGMQFVVQGVLEGISGPGGRDGYLHIDDARELLRLEQPEVSEVALRLAPGVEQKAVLKALHDALDGLTNQMGKPVFEVHPWEALSPFANIAKMIDMMTLFIRILLVAIVLVSIMNVMIMAVFERTREIGTLGAMGTRPGRILGLFLAEGALLGVLGAALGAIISLAAVAVMNQIGLQFDFGRQTGLMLHPHIAWREVSAAALLVIVVATLATLQPAWKAARMDPNQALRQV
ncbi:MAG: ABC transporter permease [Chromatiales bacterium]|nr:ABC transporter permease [Chromatiales bacterium]